jgi:cation transport regulator
METRMPYATTSELPPAVRHLPHHAQEIFLAAFNNAWKSYAGYAPADQEEAAFRVAWAAVKKRYRRRADGLWTAKP